ncbi:MAG: hypothetical protein WCH61_06780, partial [bacterium]
MTKASNRRSWRRASAAVGLLVMASLMLAGRCPAAVAGDVNGYAETALAQALAVARAAADRSAEQETATKQVAGAAVAELDAEILQAKARLRALESELLVAAAAAKPALVRAVQAEYTATHGQLETAVAWRTLQLNTVEEAGRETAVWKRRVAVVELALNLEMRVLLATPAELEARDHGPGALRQEIEVQASQVRCQVSRARSDQGQALALACDAAAIRQELKTAPTPTTTDPEAERYGRARRQQLEQLERRRQAQTQRYLRSRILAERARRNGGFLTEELAIATAYTAALELRADEGVAAMAAAQAAVAEAALAQARQAVSSRPTGMATAAAEAEFRREVVALHQALAAFARDRADQAQNELEPKSLADLDEASITLAETARTSAEAVAGFKVALNKLENQVQAARQELGVTAAAAAPVLAAVNEQVPRLARSQPGRPELLVNYLQMLARGLARKDVAGAGDVGRHQLLAECLVARQAQWALLAERWGVAESWLQAIHDDQAAVAANGTRVLWEQRDARLNWLSLAEVLAVA